MLNEEQADLQRMARDFAAAELRPRAAEWDEAGEFPVGLFRELAALGFMSMRIPETEGGIELDPVSTLLVVTELAWGDASAALAVVQHNCAAAEALSRYGTEDQRRRWFPELAAGTRLGVALPGGNDPGTAPIEARALEARRKGEGWVLDGEVSGATLASRAGLFLAFAAPDVPGGDPASERSPYRSAFLVPREVEGLTVERTGRTLGLCAAGQAGVKFHGVHLSGDALLGGEGTGDAVREEALASARLGAAAVSLGIARAALGHAARYAGEREQFGRPLSEFGGIGEKLGGMVLRTDQTRALVMAEGDRWDASFGEPGGAVAEMDRHAGATVAKIAASEAAMWCADEAVQIFGGYGYMRDYPVEKLIRDAKGMEILLGPNELLRGTLASAALRRAE
jgi:acyl-CoA dehydrogenase